ncbi:protein of unknown function DUF1003 [Pseudodesulfovibrio mercurii]|uniref:DUF1003 domain-containing protein n=1 Tax=Pseudodesulfovibrio mercurii TaxID=641491 RepID=F0JF15_9BACT|nr:DUF1003 domain-containing protein [Pseudodesulfovibrio mercurii]EGB14816.1 protein of unknown function DUF1003 [Pseudodesulfovibrio mercurii]
MSRKSSPHPSASPKPRPRHVCQICGQSKANMLPASTIRPAILAEIVKERPDFTESSYICTDDLNQFRFKYVEDIMLSEKGELSELDQEVLQSLQRNELLSSNPEEEMDRTRTRGERLADLIADFGGSWKFIILFGAFIFVWILVNTLLLIFKPFDPYPFILLNLMLSLLAAIQAPIIMMSQNRQEDKDRARAENDYKVNLKAELEIRHLHEKLDHLISNQWERLLDIQQLQVDLMTEIMSARSGKTGK